MPYMTETQTITGYYDQANLKRNNTNPLSLAEIFSENLPEPKRWPVRNREERTEISAQKRAIIHDRDGGRCRYCGIENLMLTVDHIIPRSTFSSDQLHIADRSDNLISACWPCNESKSNYEHTARKTMGVTVACWDCKNRIPDHEPHPERPRGELLAFCGRCGITYVPDLGWVL